MALIKLKGLQDIREAVLVPEAAYVLKVRSANEHVKKEKLSIRLIIDPESDDPEVEYASLFDYMAIPGEGDTEEQVAFKLLMIRRRFHYLDLEELIEAEAFEPSDLVGAESIIPIPVTIDPPSEDNNNREGRNIQWPNLPTEEEG